MPTDPLLLAPAFTLFSFTETLLLLAMLFTAFVVVLVSKVVLIRGHLLERLSDC